ncbi:MAG: hypothetical protein ACJ73S_09620 [Mycobacteriales bacterium]
MTHFVEEELRRTFAAHDPGSTDSGGEILAVVARRASRARRRRIAAAGAFIVVAATGAALPVLWPRGGGSASVGESTPKPGSTATPPAYQPPPDRTAEATRPPLQPLKLPADIHLPLRATSLPTGYAPFTPSVTDSGTLGLVAVGTADHQVAGTQILVTISVDSPTYQPEPGARHTRADVNGRTADVYRTDHGADVRWQREADQWVLVRAMSKKPRPSARDEALQVARGLVDQPVTTEYRVLFTLGPDGYAYVHSAGPETVITPGGRTDPALQISAELLRVPSSDLSAGRSFSYHGHPAVLRDHYADVDLGDGSWLEVWFGPAVTLAPEGRSALVQAIAVLPGPAK